MNYFTESLEKRMLTQQKEFKAISQLLRMSLENNYTKHLKDNHENITEIMLDSNKWPDNVLLSIKTLNLIEEFDKLVELCVKDWFDKERDRNKDELEQEIK